MQNEDPGQTTTGETTAPPARAGARGATIRSPVTMAVGVFGSFALVAVLILLGVWALLDHDREREYQRQRAEIGSLARALEEHVSRGFGQAENVAASVARTLADQGRLTPEALSNAEDNAAEWLPRLPFLKLVSIRDHTGKDLSIIRQHDAAPTLLAPPTILARAWESGGRYLTIGQPVRHEEDWYIPVSRGVVDNSDAPMAIITVMLKADHFLAFYRDIRLTEDDGLAVMDVTGNVLLRYPLVEGAIGSKVDVSRYFADASAPRAHVTMDDQAGDGSSRETSLTVYRRLVDYPLIVAMSRPTTVALSGFVEMRNRLIFGSGVLIALLGLMAWISFHDARQREEARVQLGWANASLEERVRHRTAELEQSNRELVAFSYTISHDLRAPLRAINGFSHALREDYAEILDSQGREYLDRIYRGSIRMGELIDELLSLANISRQPLNIQSVNLSTLASEIVSELQAAEPSRAVIVDIQPGMRCDGDEALLRNALYNLLQNAWKFTRGRRPAVIAMREEGEGEFQRFIIADNGVGFEMAHAKRLFQPFQQLHAREGYGGTGIGLASVRRIIERHGGRIAAEAQPDEGARFIFSLPRRAVVIRRRPRAEGDRLHGM